MGFKIVYGVLGASVAAFAASIIYIIVDKTANCQGTPTLPPNSAASFEGNTATVFCVAGYVFADGSESHQITCTNFWNTDILPKCLSPKKHPLALACQVQGGNIDDTKLDGQLVFVQEEPLADTYIQGTITGLNSTTVEHWDLGDDSCHVIESQTINRTSAASGLLIEGTKLVVNAVAKDLNITQHFNASLRILGFDRPVQRASDNFRGVALLVVDQNPTASSIYRVNAMTA